jgi:putative flippase GtrA
MICKTSNPAVRRYLRRLLGTMLLYAASLAVAIVVFVHFRPTGVPAYALAVLPAIALIGVLVVFGLYLAEEKDEFQRLIGVQSMLCGIGGTLAVTTVWGFLESFVHAPHMNPIHDFAIFWVFVGISLPVLQARYK